MTRRVLAISGLCLFAFALLIGVSAVLARSTRSRAEAAAPPAHVVAKINGKGASAGNIGETTLHHAHVRGSQPMPCTACHGILPDTFNKPDRERCLGCHPARKAALHAAVTASDVKDDDHDPRQCIRCHDFLDTRPTAERAWQCANCHKQPHTDDMRIAGTTAETCGRCHSPHGAEAVAPRACTGCHEAKARTVHQTTDDPGTGSCLACHRQHDAKENARGRCVECHFNKPPRIPTTALFAGGHESCVGCHQPHEFSKRSVRPCTSCHVGQVALAADRVGAHRDCRNCHNQHDVPSNAQKACKRCHDKSPTHPKNAHGDDCLGCHPAHPQRAASASPAVACSSCHTIAQNDHAFHRGAGCRDCHKEHNFKLTFQPSFCLGCHAGRVGAAAPVEVSTGHGDCGRCHQRNPHDPQKPPACGTCHPEPAATVPPGHATCTNCHDQHNGALKPRATECVNCHVDRKVGPHGHIKGGCLNCHRPHAPLGRAQPPTCTTCHDRTKLPGMHQVPQHATCTECHQPHGPPPTGRDRCLRCHTDRKDHEPDAVSCAACHTFRGGAP